ncbi:HU family DNA-binding protein [Desulfurobacterium sp.]
MRKMELVGKVAEKAGVTKKQAYEVLEAFFKVIKQALKENEKVEIRGFGTFYMKKMAARSARNLKTGERIKIPPRLVPAFKPGANLKAAIKVLKKG